MKTTSIVFAVLFAAACGGAETTTTTPEGSASTQTAQTTPPPPPSTPPPPPSTNPTTQPSAVASTPPAASSSAPTAGPPDAARGEKLFADNHCDGCHGTKAKPGKTDIFTKVKWNDDEKKKGISNIKNGKAPMPKFDKLSDAQIADLMEYITKK
jgi:mono/diheme cytochrome c family protein